jgi:glycosyltransferase involved in cell wall biosynthesis
LIRPKLLYLITEDWYFWSHRLPIARAAKAAGFEVLVATRVNQHGTLIEQAGLRLIPIKLKRKSYNPCREILAICEVISIYRRERPTIVHHVAMKPILYGSIAAHITCVPAIVNALAGLGYLFTSNRWYAKLSKRAEKIAFRLILNTKKGRMIVQNPDDFIMLERGKVVDKGSLVLIKGSGVDTDIFSPTPFRGGVPIILLASRMLWDKGIGEFVNASKILSSRGIKARFVLVGKSDPENPNSIPESQLMAWHGAGVIEWWGHRNDMPEVFSQSHIVCLPTFYGEGIPKVLIEAASCGRPIITTNSPGCREIVKHGANGYLIPVKNSEALASAIGNLVEAPELWVKMGNKGREMVMNEFSIEIVISKTISLYKELLSLSK